MTPYPVSLNTLGINFASLYIPTQSTEAFSLYPDSSLLSPVEPLPSIYNDLALYKTSMSRNYRRDIPEVFRGIH